MAKKENLVLIHQMKRSGALKSPRIVKAFSGVDRIDFVPEEFRDNAYLDVPVPIPGVMTTSQPSTIAFMLEILNPKAGDRILEIGTGSGYVTALLAELVGKRGEVHSIEALPELKDFAEKNLKKYKYRNIHLYLGDGKTGLPDKSPFDKIISGAEIAEIPDTWRAQLKYGGVIVTPSDNHVLRATKITEKDFQQNKYPYFKFIRMV